MTQPVGAIRCVTQRGCSLSGKRSIQFSQSVSQSSRCIYSGTVLEWSYCIWLGGGGITCCGNTRCRCGDTTPTHTIPLVGTIPQTESDAPNRWNIAVQGFQGTQCTFSTGAPTGASSKYLQRAPVGLPAIGLFRRSFQSRAYYGRRDYDNDELSTYPPPREQGTPHSGEHNRFR